tara:strand:+ start:626 stop:1330 length:705 start_codon:yes stop_codon:yes gene_type:complete
VKNKKIIGITGANGALGKSLTKIYKDNGYKVIGFTHTKDKTLLNQDGPNEWIYWECGKEYLLENFLKKVDILILNHGIYQQDIKNSDFEKALNINAFSHFKLINLFKKISLQNEDDILPKEIWINTSEAEILPALSPSYEISKTLIGSLVTYQNILLSENERKKLFIRKIIIGPFKSKLNPIGLMNPNFVALMIYYISKTKLNLIIVTPNPISYLIFPLKELYYYLYYNFLKFL